MKNKEENKNQYYIDNMDRLAVVHFKHVRENGSRFMLHPSLDYHIHFLIFHNKEKKYCGAILLDTDDIIARPLESERSDIYDISNEMIRELSQHFIDKIGSSLQCGKLNEKAKIIFQKSDDSLWACFNENKQKTYIRDLNRFHNYSRGEDEGTTDAKHEIYTHLNKLERKDIQEVPLETYKGVEIWVSEDRKVGVVGVSGDRKVNHM